jgi:hypothetical protein
LWLYRPAVHKTQHHGHERTIYLGPLARAIVETHLKPDTQAHLFSPADAEATRLAEVHEARKTPIGYGNSPGKNRVRNPKRKPGPRYTVAAYRRAITRACAKADRVAHERDQTIPADQVVVQAWHPHQRGTIGPARVTFDAASSTHTAAFTIDAPPRKPKYKPPLDRLKY